MSLGSLVGGLLGGSNPLISLGISVMTGGAGGVAMEFAKQVVSQLAQNAIQNSMLPPLGKSLALDVLKGILGDGMESNPRTNEGVAEKIADATGMDLCECQAKVDELGELIDKMVQDFLENNTPDKADEKSATSGKGSWIMRMAEALGKVLDEKVKQVDASIAEVTRLNGNKGDTVSTGHKLSGAGKEAERALPGATAEMQGHMQELSFIMSAISTAIKAAGEGSNQLARKT